MATITKKTVLITGCSEGSLGAALALAFAKRDFHVFATLRNPAKAGPLASHPNIEILSLEVTNAQSISSCAAEVGKKTDGSLDILVNNAGVMFAMPLLDTSIEESKKLFDVNVWGMLAVTQAFAPMLVRSKGVILNIASIAGAVRMAWQGVYNSSKACVRWFSETLRIEMQGLDVRVITAMIGEVETKIYDNAGQTDRALPTSSYYKSIKHLIFQQASGEMQVENEKAEVTAESLVRDVLSGRDGHVWRGGVAGRAKYFHWMLPERLFEWALHVHRGVYQVRAP
ncbi:NADPH-dependent 1-acyldihydroxyacetone phosphate reductase [Daldinia childiae]|uniref:NADPH-dependent 1-acyldihydroxyacetone phosphate reductase n=1 Tax=Daldinia childiae TaxID=326645 RepID=UPI0014450F12|nr:NADPH-dependent 1-acyldihydroxyacetone phosphate reductase [Daldinia childiae]KAF3055678.1 NADPH-dependent 1-acyldihydroxyacetone phosphate reductase [Daldinia childiae]